MGNLDDLKAKQQELSKTEQELRNTKNELKSKENELENARLKNEDEKTELINQLISQIGNLKENAEEYEKEITSIKAQVDELQKRLDSTQQTVSTQPTVSAQQTTEQPASTTTAEQTVSDQPTTEQTVSDQPTTEQTVSTQPTTEQPAPTTNTEQPSSTTNTEQTVSTTTAEQTVSTQPTTEQPASTTTVEQPNLTLDSYEWYNKTLSGLIYEIDWYIATAKYKRWLNKSWKETLKTAKAKLKQYKSIITGKKEHLEHEFKVKNKLNAKNPDKVPLTVSISASEINELKRRNDRIVNIKKDIDAWKDGKSSNLAPWPNQSLEQVKKWNNVDRHHIEYDSKLNEALKEAALLRVFDNNQDRVREFLQGIANNSLSDNQITICQMYRSQLDPCFQKYGLTDQVHRCIQTRGWRYNNSYQNYWNMDWETAYKTWWVTGWLNNTLIKAFPNAKPEHVSNFTNIAVTVGWIYAIYKIWKWFFGKDKDWDRNLWWKAAGLAGLYFAPQLLLWQDGFSLLWDIISWKADFSELRYRAWNSLRFLNNNSPEVYAQMAPWILWMHIFPQNYKVENVRALQQTFADPNARKQWYTVTYNRLNKDNSALANEFKNTFNENQYNETEWNIFLAKLWITDKTEWSVVVLNEALKTADKKTSFELWMKSQWKEINPNFKKEVDTYLKQEWEFNPENLNKNWFKDNNEAKYTMREEDFQNKEKLNGKVNSLPLNDQQKSELKTALESFYDERTIASKPNPNDFDLKIENWKLVLTSHWWYEAEIDLDKKQLIWFWSFTNLSDLLNVADLSNKILETQKWKQPVDMPPFQYKSYNPISSNWIGKGWRWIYFNDESFFSSINFDTRLLSWWWWWKMWEIKELEKNPEDFADYLSKRWKKANKLDINMNQYPTIKRLSDSWVIFFNEQEIKQAEVRLNNVKESRSTANGGPTWYEPFSIDGDKLIFTTLNWKKIAYPDSFDNNFSLKSLNLSNFPAIKAKQDDFLKFMNDKKNWMWGSKLNTKTS